MHEIGSRYSQGHISMGRRDAKRHDIDCDCDRLAERICKYGSHTCDDVRLFFNSHLRSSIHHIGFSFFFISTMFQFCLFDFFFPCILIYLLIIMRNTELTIKIDVSGFG